VAYYGKLGLEDIVSKRPTAETWGVPQRVVDNFVVNVFGKVARPAILVD
jgi:hypothetical protein